MVGRRGPAQAAFTTPELIELGELEGADVIVDPAELEGAEPTRHELASATSRCCASTRPARPRESRSGSCCGSSRSPVAILGEERVEGIELVRNRLEPDATAALAPCRPARPRRSTCGIVFRSVGYRGVALPGVPFDESRGTIANERGRVGAGGLRGRLDQARPERRHRHEQEGRDGDGRAAARGSARRAAQGPGARGDRAPARRARRAARRLLGLDVDRRARARRRREARPPAREALHLGRAARPPRRRRVLHSNPMSSTEQKRELWGGETAKAIANFPVSGEPIPAPVARWLGRIKGAAARANADLGLLDRDKADRIAAAAPASRTASSTTSSRSTSSRPARARART